MLLVELVMLLFRWIKKMAMTLLKGRTYRFTQTDNSNDNHPLIISTSNSSTLGHF